MKYFGLALIFLLSGMHLLSQQLRFFREDISFVLEPECFQVHGEYYFSNPGMDSVKSVLRYPYPIDESFGPVDSVFCYADKGTQADPVIGSNQQHTDFKVHLAPGESKVYHIGYRQKLSGNKAQYILRSTASWGEGFDSVNYSLYAKHVEIDSLSYTPDKVILKENVSEFYWRKKDFMPRKDFLVFFHPLD